MSATGPLDSYHSIHHKRKEGCGQLKEALQGISTAFCLNHHEVMEWRLTGEQCATPYHLWMMLILYWGFRRNETAPALMIYISNSGVCVLYMDWMSTPTIIYVQTSKERAQTWILEIFLCNVGKLPTGASMQTMQSVEIWLQSKPWSSSQKQKKRLGRNRKLLMGHVNGWRE